MQVPDPTHWMPWLFAPAQLAWQSARLPTPQSELMVHAL